MFFCGSEYELRQQHAYGGAAEDAEEGIALPQVQAQQHGGRRSQQGKAQRHRGFGRRDMFTEIPAGLPLLLTGEPV